MSRIVALVGKDLRRRLADPAGLLLSLCIPLAIAGTMALAFGTRPGGEAGTPKIRLVLVDEDEMPFTSVLAGSGQNPEAAKHFEVKRAASREEGVRLMRDEAFNAMLVFPKGFSSHVLDEGRGEVEVVKNPSQSVMPIAAQQSLEVGALYASLFRSLMGDEAWRLRDLFNGDGWQDAAGVAALVAATYGRVQSAKSLLFPPLIEVKEEKPAGEKSGSNWMAWMYPGMVVMGILFVSLSQMRDLVHERTAGTLKRMFAAPVTPGQILASKVLSVAVVVAASLVILLVMGSIFFGIAWGDPAPLAVVSGLLVLAATGFAALLYALVRTERQGEAIGSVLVMVMSLLGGSFVPSQVLPAFLQRVSLFTLSYWGHESLRALAAGGGFKEVAPFLPVIAAIGLGSTLAGSLLLRLRHLRGAL